MSFLCVKSNSMKNFAINTVRKKQCSCGKIDKKLIGNLKKTEKSFLTIFLLSRKKLKSYLA